MHIILTHELADFDAIASLLGGYLLVDTAMAILPRRVNRNVRNFLALYGEDFPFIDARDLPKDLHVDDVTLVDTQSLISVKGVHVKTHVHVIDHHPLREDIPDTWSITVSATGANTTIIVEMLQEKEIHLLPIQATLLLLGIYEDTGSFTYVRITARDLRAAGYLIEQGANLSLIAKYLNQPLTPEQQALYNRLSTNSELIDVHGRKIFIACEDSCTTEEELSTIAHKLRDFYEPDALFVLVLTRGGVQLIARSTKEDINVAEIATHFGGGGHERAAASLIKGRQIDEIRNELLQLLEKMVKPSYRVAHIMSKTPQLLSPETPVEDAALKMQRYGYEGYPIVQRGKVVGLLTRRAVDRAIAHKLNLSAANLMEVGEYFTHPDDSIERLQQLMTESGWGQIPVVDPVNENIIGIVTRTDLLKILSPLAKLPVSRNYARRLEKALPIARLTLLKEIAEQATHANVALYIVGGFVRDLLIESPIQDFDLVVEGEAIPLAKRLAELFGGRVISHDRFGTAKWFLPEIKEPLLRHLLFSINDKEIPYDVLTDLPTSIDIVSARREFYAHPTALPTVERGSIKLDLHRRDFTINTMALRLDGHHYGELLDYWGGLNDLRSGVVRVLHSLSFIDDPTRILRAVRFEKRFGFRIEKRTLQLISEATSLLCKVSGERIRHELDNIFIEPQALLMLERMSELGLFSAINATLGWDVWRHERASKILNDDPGSEWQLGSDKPYIRKCILFTLLLIHSEDHTAKQIEKRLMLSRNLIEIIDSARKLLLIVDSLIGKSPHEVVEQLDKTPRLAIYIVYHSIDRQDEKNLLNQFVATWCNVWPNTDGNLLSSLGVSPGPVYRRILKSLRDAWLDGRISTQEEEKRLLYEILQTQ